jgi:hypothetical protein
MRYFERLLKLELSFDRFLVDDRPDLADPAVLLLRSQALLPGVTKVMSWLSMIGYAYTMVHQAPERVQQGSALAPVATSIQVIDSPWLGAVH